MVKLSTSVLEELWFGEDDPAVADAKAAQLQSQIDAAAVGDVSPQVAAARADVAGLEPAAAGATLTDQPSGD